MPHLQQVIALLHTCAPKRATSTYRVVWAIEDGDSDPPKCSLGSNDRLEQMRAELVKAKVIGVDYEASGQLAAPVPVTRFLLRREGISVGGSSTALVYHVRPQPCGRLNERFSEGFWRVTQSLTGKPCQWFIEVTKN
jgi:hypothetical protein